MTAPRGSTSNVESSSGSSDAEELARCRAAAVPAWGLEQRPEAPEKRRADATNNQLPTAQPSLRHKVDEHEQDGNELQTTPEFRAYVAKKLGDLLDSSITISEAVKEPAKAEAQKATPEDDGFRLFFTSVPEGPEGKAAPRPRRRKRLPSRSSSEDSEEEWQRCQEAAVAASAILRESAIHGPVQVEKEAKKKKGKLKKKARKEASTDLTAATITGTATARKQEEESATLHGDLVSPGSKKKKRKKKAKKATEASPLPPSKSAAAAPAH
ncbi:protein CUSTOS isoform X1 [Pipistrellus kuhlii]|uniref:Protein CUSTOS n=1 Tax=Pipistrellus kuhlii TaxID=59472 RepID=A0A7J7UFQ2_PIPKU|nr:protein CUSTOS isoform X1 [Pipistrellus kuhlii]KAF6311602.1 hypothetical protein mPipKuh1_001652 [Pipistrellus kuhlii]